VSRGEDDFFVWALFQQLIRRDFAIGLEEYGAVMRALRAGFGWESQDDLKKLLCALWATSREEAAVISALFDQYVVGEWSITSTEISAPIDDPSHADLEITTTTETPPESIGGPEALVPPERVEGAPAVATASRLPPLRLEELPRLSYSHVFLPQYPVSYRQVAQTWRRLRSPLRAGPPTELDIEATVARRSRRGIASPPVLRPRRRNQAHLLLLVDRKGSMAPFHGYVESVCVAIAQAGRLGRVGIYYFHDTPLEGADLEVLDALEPELFPSLDPILADLPPLTRGELYEDPELLEPCPAEEIFKAWPGQPAIVIISDGGAARGRLDPVRLLDTIASLKGLQTLSSRIVWLNPLPSSSWSRSTARQIARHVPMFTMDRDGMHRAVNVLRGQPAAIARPIPRSGVQAARPSAVN
jgi:uncharacterized protein with von Willebrand factor type A (vWA) domain